MSSSKLKILQVNTVANLSSIGRTAELIGKLAIEGGFEMLIAFGQKAFNSKFRLYKIGNSFDLLWHIIVSRLFDRHGFGSKNATLRFIKKIELENPDVIFLHNLHGYFLNMEVLFQYLKTKNTPIIWTLFDCWAFTGHCSYFTYAQCNKWITGCSHCPQLSSYPKSIWRDNSAKNYKDKSYLFNLPSNMKLIVHSAWLKEQVGKSFLKKHETILIHNEIDINVFKPKSADMLRKKLGIEGKKVILGVAAKWEERKGFTDFVNLLPVLTNEYVIILIGEKTSNQNKSRKGIININRTENLDKLVDFYSMADVFVNPTYDDNFPTTNIEALACGTPVITYNSGGSAEIIDELTGIVVTTGDIMGLKSAIVEIVANGKLHYSHACRNRAVTQYDAQKNLKQYLDLAEVMYINSK